MSFSSGATDGEWTQVETGDSERRGWQIRRSRSSLRHRRPRTPWIGASRHPGARVIDRLRAGNASGLRLLMKNCWMSLAREPVVVPCDKMEVGLGEHDLYGRPKQSPFALILGCSDAREPAEILLGQGFDDLFTVRVAGNVLGDECVGSVIYALDKFAPKGNSSAPGSLKLILVIGHRNCGAVHAAVEAHEDDPSSLLERVGSTPHPLAAIVARIAPVVTVSAWAIDSSYGPSRFIGQKAHRGPHGDCRLSCQTRPGRHTNSPRW